MSAVSDQRQSALTVANAIRIERAALRRELRTDPGALRRALFAPPDFLDTMAVLDLVRLAGTVKSTQTMRRLGAAAVHDGINLLIPVGMASLATRRWVAEHVEIRGSRLTFRREAA